MDPTTIKLTRQYAAIAYAKVLSEAIRTTIEECVYDNPDVPIHHLLDSIERRVCETLSTGPNGGALEEAIHEWALTVLGGEDEKTVANAAHDMMDTVITGTFKGSQVYGPYCGWR